MKRVLFIEVLDISFSEPDILYSNVLEHETPAHITQVLQEMFDMVMEELKDNEEM